MIAGGLSEELLINLSVGLIEGLLEHLKLVLELGGGALDSDLLVIKLLKFSFFLLELFLLFVRELFRLVKLLLDLLELRRDFLELISIILIGG